jgi:hypothetical protein
MGRRWERNEGWRVRKRGGIEDEDDDENDYEKRQGNIAFEGQLN